VPEITNFGSEAEESAFIVQRVKAWLAQGLPSSSICVAARTNRLLETRYTPLLGGR